MTRRKDKTNGKRQTKMEGEHGERQKGEEKRRNKEKGKNVKGKGKRQGCPCGTIYVDYLGVNGADAPRR